MQLMLIDIKHINYQSHMYNPEQDTVCRIYLHLINKKCYSFLVNMRNTLFYYK
jgi:hypothetical protein